MSNTLTTEAFVDQVYRKTSKIPPEYIRFGAKGQFWHRHHNTEWTAHPYRIREDGFELDWGRGAVFQCVWNGERNSSSSFIEMNLNQDTWELANDYHDYRDAGSTSN